MARLRYKYWVDTFAADIRSGRLAPGTRLPTHRRLAADNGMSLATASRVYAELESMGLVSGEAGRGTFVREIGLPLGQGIDQPPSPDLVDLSFNYPSLPSQTEALRLALRQLTTSGALGSLLHYQPHGGRPHERASIAKYLVGYGLEVTAANVLIVSGAQHGLATVMMGLCQPGDVVAVDALTYTGFKVLAQTLRIELLPIPVTTTGPDLNVLAQLCQQRRIRALYSMPTLHNPLGWVLSLAQRQRLIELARQHQCLLIEDAAYAFLIEDAPPPLAALAPDITLYVSGFSKSVATGLRVGYIAAPLSYVAALERVIRATVWNTPAMLTAIVCDWLEEGTVALFEAEKRLDARQRQAIAQAVFADMPFIAHPGAYFIWLPLPEGVRADQVAMTLMTAGVAVATAEPFATSTCVPHALRLALGSVPLATLKERLMMVKRVIMNYIDL
ncbi:MAG: PLP-dependent aminotransferase family protein [Neisseriaceae bacterium]|nr:PLP-dependent aminotransferase family protein [Neisseriaceae bacterium]MBP6860969.1 PLP-dependent aminotransferase family protein [Neisseriaceae bacterium]